jgi:hypothetical protein
LSTEYLFKVSKAVQAKKLYFFFYLAALMFVAKPFIGFSITGIDSASIIESHSLLAKSFTNRKPEDLEDSKAKSGAIHQQLTNPPLPLLLTITALLSLLFPLLFKSATRTGNSFINELKTALVPAVRPYLLTGKLTI